jgi:Protein of unknown function (DUF3761)
MKKVILIVVALAAAAGIAFLTKMPAYHGPPNATARCHDDTLSYSEHYSGTCSWHGGVESWNGATLFDQILHKHPSCDDPDDPYDDNDVYEC